MERAMAESPGGSEATKLSQPEMNAKGRQPASSKVLYTPPLTG